MRLQLPLGAVPPQAEVATDYGESDIQNNNNVSSVSGFWRMLFTQSLESYLRELISEGNEAYVIADAFGSGGTGANGDVTYSLAGGKITVPAYTWKIVLLLT